MAWNRQSGRMTLKVDSWPSWVQEGQACNSSGQDWVLREHLSASLQSLSGQEMGLLPESDGNKV